MRGIVAVKLPQKTYGNRGTYRHTPASPCGLEEPRVQVWTTRPYGGHSRVFSLLVQSSGVLPVGILTWSTWDSARSCRSVVGSSDEISPRQRSATFSGIGRMVEGDVVTKPTRSLLIFAPRNHLKLFSVKHFHGKAKNFQFIVVHMSPVPSPAQSRLLHSVNCHLALVTVMEGVKITQL